jgi:hypothetical protein
VSAQDLSIVIGALAAGLAVVLAAIGALWAKVHSYRAEVNGRVDQLLEETRNSGRLQGKAESPRKYPPDWTQ